MNIIDIHQTQLDLGKRVKEGCAQEDLIGLMFNTIGVR